MHQLAAPRVVQLVQTKKYVELMPRTPVRDVGYTIASDSGRVTGTCEAEIDGRWRTVEFEGAGLLLSR